MNEITNPRFLTLEQWNEYAKTCDQSKDTQGGHFCVIDGITGYCDYWSCQRRKQR